MTVEKKRVGTTEERDTLLASGWTLLSEVSKAGIVRGYWLSRTVDQKAGKPKGRSGRRKASGGSDPASDDGKTQEDKPELGVSEEDEDAKA